MRSVGIEQILRIKLTFQQISRQLKFPSKIWQWIIKVINFSAVLQTAYSLKPRSVFISCAKEWSIRWHRAANRTYWLHHQRFMVSMYGILCQDLSCSLNTVVLRFIYPEKMLMAFSSLSARRENNGKREFVDTKIWCRRSKRSLIWRDPKRL